MTDTVHIIGAGLAGLSAAVKLASAGTHVVVHEGTALAGGRCRSYYDAVTGLTIDNGSHLLLSGNHAARSYLRTIGTEAQLVGPETALFDFVDLATRARWTLDFGNGWLPWWVFDARRRVPGTGLMDYLPAARLLWAREDETVGDRLRCSGTLYDRLMHPLLLAALNVEPPEGSARLAGAVLRETLALGGQACRPLVAGDGLGPAFIEPAIAFLQAHGGSVRFGHELHAMTFANTSVTALDFGEDTVTLDAADRVILAVPPYAAAALVPELIVPTQFRSIFNFHFAVAHADTPRILGVVNGTIEWLFAFPDRIAITISNADRFLDQPRDALALTIWKEICDITGLAGEIPRWQLVRERRATIASTPAECAKRPATTTRWTNLFLAGDWTATGLPPTIEGTVRSGHRAAELAAQKRAYA
jgi:squalene-associated FAD-dependent desaturase